VARLLITFLSLLELQRLIEIVRFSWKRKRFYRSPVRKTYQHQRQTTQIPPGKRLLFRAEKTIALKKRKLEEPADPTSHSSHRLNRIQSGRDVSPRFPSAQPY
jgi:hypothetical protein